MSAKRPSPSCDVLPLAKKPTRRNASSDRIFNQLQHLNTTQSPFLRLPAELRNRVYELVFADRLIHVEHERAETETSHKRVPHTDEPLNLPHLSSNLAYRGKVLRYYICKSSLSENDAYQRSKDVSLNEQQPSSQNDGIDIQNYWRMGDRFHIDPCKDRHEVCVPAAPVPDWMMAPWEKSNKPNTHLDRILNLHVTRVCQQVYHETKLLPFALNTFVFRHATAFLRFFLCLRAFQAQAVKEVCIFMTAGQRHDDHTLTSRWNNALFVSPLIDRLKGLRILHISITISHTGIGDNGPVRSELADPVQLDSWVIGLQRLRGLPLRDATVIVSDDPNSKFGIEGYSDKFLQYGWNGTHQTWLTLRERECFTAEEKRRWAERIKSMLLKKPVNPP